MYLQTLIWTLVLLAAYPAAGGCQLTLGPEWNRAVESVASHRATWSEVFATLHVEPAECEAIIFPEQLRYSRLQDGMEQAVVQTFYVQGGNAKGNFSIGPFQMKPSFAEEVERAWMESPMRHEYKLYFDLGDNRHARGKRIERLKDERWQCIYLAIFVRLLLAREPSLLTLPAEERVGLLATAYNFSFTASLPSLQQRKSRRTFHLDLLPGKGTTYYSYAELSVYYYKNYNLKIT